ncbi:pectinesterase-like [Neltuma alba]|uniref:pectinesterase-like n=1 Tax=Neltuma alba TaxID=207710 RepID=UPI0010A38815|nr:pectinesterase-like [Prosopis alba]
MNKIFLPGVALILVVGCAVGTILVVRQSNSGGSGGDQLASHNKAVTAICQGSDNQKECEDTLGSVNSSDPKEYITTAVAKVMQKVIGAANMTDKLAVEHGSGDKGVKMAIDDCQDLLQSAIDSLEASNAMLKGDDIRSIENRTDDVKNWLAMVLSFQQSCYDGFEAGGGEEKIRDTLHTQGGLDDIQKLTGVALDVLAGLNNLLSAFNLDLTVKAPSRRLLEEEDHSWLSEADRKLLDAANPQPNAVVAKDGSGQYKTITDALNAYPKNHQGRFIIYVKAGTYNEYPLVDKKKPNVYMYGDGATKTIVTGNRCVEPKKEWRTFNSATFAIVGDMFIAKGIGFDNTAGSIGHQAVAVRTQAAHAAFFQCAFRGFQDTLYVQAGIQLFRECEITGTIDFIFGASRTLIQKSKIILRKPMENQQDIVVADGSINPKAGTGVVIQNCDISAEPGLDKNANPCYLARPWKAYSKAIFMESTLGDIIHPDGYLPWTGDMYLKTCYFAEYANTGPGFSPNTRVKWGRGQLTKDQAAAYTATRYLEGMGQPWLAATGVPFDPTFTKA